jgi:hypothetical protein
VNRPAPRDYALAALKLLVLVVFIVGLACLLEHFNVPITPEGPQ